MRERLDIASRGGPSLAERAYRAIREEILRGQLRPGTPLSRRRLARELEMSIVPVADALRRLEDDGLVESRPRAGTRVRIPSEKDVRELYDLREALETQSARLFAERATPAQRRELQRLAEEVDALFDRLAASGQDPAFRFTVHSRHVGLHMHIAEHAGSGLLGEMIERNHVLILNWLFDVAGRRTALPPGFHARLAEELVSGDPARADAAMRAHVRYGLVEISGRIGALKATEWRERPAAGRGGRAAARRGGAAAGGG
ncbi:MAG TPA: GntR family transcriptional regulator [Vicinamibacteria bacterium]|jgi:GntR family transcriptional regulator, rspAB operon transcriptional repressor|nr:GntR family transcriptional regulator [Vicinamibacteria bacterium]